MNFDNSDPSVADLLARMRALLGPAQDDPAAPPNTTPILGPGRLQTGLIGSGWARFMADQNLPQPPVDLLSRDPFYWHARAQAALGAGDGRSGAAPPTGTGAVFGPEASGVETDQPVVDPAASYEVAGPPGGTAKPPVGGRNDPSFQQQLKTLKQYLPTVEGGMDERGLTIAPDKLGHPTVGVGHKVVPADGLKLGDRISNSQREAFLQQDATAALDAARAQAAKTGVSDPNFMAPLASVNFQLGPDWYHGKNGFKKTWGLINSGDYAGAADEVARSDWNAQTPNRVAAFQKALRALPPRPASGD